MKNMEPNPPAVAIIGIGCIFADSPDLKSFYSLLAHGKSGISDPPPSHSHLCEYMDPDRKKKDHIYCNRGGYLPAIDFDPVEFGIPPNLLEATDTSQLLSLMTAKRAIEDAGYGEHGKSFDRNKASVILGVTGTQELVIPLGARLGHPLWRRALDEAGVPREQAEEVVDRIGAGYVDWQENSFPGLLGNVVAGRIANRLDFGGTNCVVDAACASSMGALHMSLLELLTNRSDMVITGGVDTINDAFMHMCFAKTQLLSPSGDIRPFSEDADGTVLGEGVGLVVLKRLADAKRDNDRIYAVIKGIGSASDGKAQSIYAPRQAGQAKALERAYQSAGIDPSTVTMVEAHGTGTSVGDMVEFNALCDVFGAASPNGNGCALGSVKSNIGHTKAAAGTAGLIKSALAIYHKILPPTLKAEQTNPKLGIEHSPFYLNHKLRPWLIRDGQTRKAGVSSFGFGGSNFHAVLEEHLPQKQEISWDGTIEIAAFSGSDSEDLANQFDQWAQKIEQKPTRHNIGKLAHQSRLSYHVTDPHRAVIVLELTQDLGELFDELRAALIQCGKTGRSDHASLFYGNGNNPGRLAFLFPGQGSQYIGMGRDLICCFPQSLSSFQNAGAHLDKEHALDDVIFPRTSVDRDGHTARLRDTRIAQPAIGAVSVAMHEALTYFGVTPHATCGHSFGELVALYAAGWMDQSSLWQLSKIRGRLMSEAGKAQSETGKMLAVKAPLDELASLIQSNDLPVVLANRNTPHQGVLSGPSSAIDAAAKACRSKGWAVIPLPVSAAFHSDMVSDAQKPFAGEIEKIQLAPTSIDVMSNTKGTAYPRSAPQIKAILAAQLARPVNFAENIKSLYEQGVRTFVEVGPQKILTNMVKAVLEDQEVVALAVDQSCGKHSGLHDLARTVSELAAMGYDIALTRWEKSKTAVREARMMVPLSGANYRSPQTTRKAKKRPTVTHQKDTPNTMSSDNVIRTEHAKRDGHPIQVQQDPTLQPMDDIAQNTIQKALLAAKEGMASLQALQSQTTRAHEKFLETQAEASKTLRQMLQSTRQLAAASTSATVDRSMFLFDETESIDAKVPPQMQAASIPGEPEGGSAPPAADISTAQTTPSNDAPSHQPTSIVSQTLVQIVSELTGYPEQMLGLDMDIEADLGIDSIKRVEILSALEEKLPHLPQVTPDMMGTLKTLGQICDFLGSGSEQGTSSPVAEPAAVQAPAASTTADPSIDAGVLQTLVQIVSELTGYPEQMLGLDMDIEADLGIDSIKRVEILSALEEKLPHLPQVTPDMMGTLKTLGQICDYLGSGSEQGTSSPVAEPAAVQAPAASTTADPSIDAGVLQTLVQIVSELTGYPEQMLGLDMDIEADLGIDSIKRVEILSALEEKLPHLPQVTPDMMGTLKTLGQICDYLDGGQVAQPSVPGVETTQPIDDEMHSASHDASLTRKVVRVVASPKPAVGPKWIVPKNRYIGIAGANDKLKQALIRILAENDIAARSLTDPEDFADSPAPVGLILIAPMQTEQMFLWAQKAAALHQASSQNQACFCTVTFLDGSFGFGDAVIEEPAHGAMIGLTKTAAIEWPSVRCLALDIDPRWVQVEEIASSIADELIYPQDSGVVEVGLSSAQRINLELKTSVLVPAKPIDLTDDDVAVVTGGARGVTAVAAQALAMRTGCKLALIGRTPAIAKEPEWLASLTEPQEMKRAILTQLFADQTPTPMEVEAAYQKIQSNRQIHSTLAQLSEKGCVARYYNVDVRKPQMVKATLEKIHKEQGSVKAVIHGAGVLADRLIAEKQIEQFQKVYDTKVKGLEALLAAIDKDALHYLVLFSSVSARMGNVGQSDYAMANEVLNKTAKKLSPLLPHCKIVSINWGPWDGGMVTPALKAKFAANGVGLIPQMAGAEAMVEEMASARSDDVEVVIGSVFEKARSAETTPADEPKKIAAADLSITAKRAIDIQNHPVLLSHQLDGRPVVPLAIMTEWLAHSALHANPGLSLHGIDQLRLLKGIVLDDKNRDIQIMAGKARRVDHEYHVDVDIRGDALNGGNVIHASAKAILTESHPEAPSFDIDMHMNNASAVRSTEDIYDQILFHGSKLHGLQKILHFSDKMMIASVAAAPSPNDWMVKPLRSRWITDPLVIDCAFQMAIVWCHERFGQVSLPSYADNYRQYRDRFPGDGVIAAMQLRQSTKRKMICDFTFMDKDHSVVATMSGYNAIMTPSLMRAFKAA